MGTNGELRTQLELKTDEELIELLRERDEKRWRPEVFSLVEQILSDRGVPFPPLKPSAIADGNGDILVVVASFFSVAEAEPCRSALIAAGFDVVGLDQFMLQVSPGIAPAFGGMRLAVPSRQAEQARAFLAAADHGDLTVPMECPACGSPVVLSERRTNKAGTAVNYLLLGVPVPDRRISFHCKSCDHEWQ